MFTKPSFVLVTGATGFIGSHVVDSLLARGIRVRGATRSMEKGDKMIKERPAYAGKLEFVQIQDFESPTSLEEAVDAVDAIIHVASPFRYDITDNEKELVLPAINGVRSMLDAAAKHSSVRRVVVTSSFAAVKSNTRKAPPYFTYTAEDWNPLTYEEAVDPASSSVTAYQGSKKFAELEAWKFVKERKPGFDLVTLCPPMVFGPVVHPVASVNELNESNANLWKAASGEALPLARVPFWVDVRDLAEAHAEAALKESAGGKRFTVVASDRFSYRLAADIMAKAFPELDGVVQKPEQEIDMGHGLDGQTAAKELGLTYRTFDETIRDFTAKALKMNRG